ncbi:MAG: TonB C-terminal domain-containing protein [Candidatus Latescibacteria bacterium]|nr:TonB C-terminal domain-containing protein [Candidatus Latescibacterota bacterium]
MKKELLLSCIGHILLFGALLIVTRPSAQEKLYPDVFQVSVVNLESGTDQEEVSAPVAVIDQKPAPVKKPATKPKEKPTQTKPPAQTKTDVGLKISSKGGKYSYYIDAILTKIGSNWINPYQGSGIKLSSTVYFVIRKDGTIANVKIEKRSGNELYDSSTERAVIVTKTLPPLAGEFANQDSLIIHLEFEYKP